MRWPLPLLGVCCCLALAACGQSQPTPVPVTSPGTPPVTPSKSPAPGNRWALLIGCSKYENLSEKYQLAGPENDVPLLREVLMQHYQFPASNIVVL